MPAGLEDLSFIEVEFYNFRRVSRIRKRLFYYARVCFEWMLLRINIITIVDAR